MAEEGEGETGCVLPLQRGGSVISQCMGMHLYSYMCIQHEVLACVGVSVLQHSENTIHNHYRAALMPLQQVETTNSKGIAEAAVPYSHATVHAHTAHSIPRWTQRPSIR